jgi:hypothetical protein
MDLWNVGILPQHYVASQPRRPRPEVVVMIDTFSFTKWIPTQFQLPYLGSHMVTAYCGLVWTAVILITDRTLLETHRDVAIGNETIFRVWVKLILWTMKGNFLYLRPLRIHCFRINFESEHIIKFVIYPVCCLNKACISHCVIEIRS